jgi:hypothetical protein
MGFCLEKKIEGENSFSGAVDLDVDPTMRQCHRRHMSEKAMAVLSLPFMCLL